jgi:LPXTG-site transpeptidase (sortase) family protein
MDWFDARGGLHSRSYAVSIIRVIEPRDVALLAPTADDSLTLITCYPFGRSPRSPQRFVVRAAPVGAGKILGGGLIAASGRQEDSRANLGR